LEELVSFNCPADSYNELASLWMTAPETSIKQLFHFRGKSPTSTVPLSSSTLLLFFIPYQLVFTVGLGIFLFPRKLLFLLSPLSVYPPTLPYLLFHPMTRQLACLLFSSFLCTPHPGHDRLRRARGRIHSIDDCGRCYGASGRPFLQLRVGLGDYCRQRHLCPGMAFCYR